MSAFDQLTCGLGEKPSQALASARALTMSDLEKVIDAGKATTNVVGSNPKPGEIWPLLSHHAFNQSSLFGDHNHGEIHSKALTLLLAHDGLVSSDPLIDIERAWAVGHKADALRSLQTVTEQVAQVEPLIEKNYLRFTVARPTLTDRHRRALLDLFGITPDMVVFANFEQAYPDVVRFRRITENDYLSQVEELFRLFGLQAPDLKSAEAGRLAIRRLGSAFIHVTWQLAVCADNPSCDLSLTSQLEQELFDQVIIRATGHMQLSRADKQRGGTRFVSRLSIGALPNLDTSGLSIKDAITLRTDDAFAQFRDQLRNAMSCLPEVGAIGQLKSEKEAEFEEKMQEAAKNLLESTKKASFKDRIKKYAMPASLGFLSSTSAALMMGAPPTLSLAAAPAGGATATIIQWLHGRRQSKRDDIACRYFSNLGGEWGRI